MLQYNVFRLHAMYKTDSLILQVGQVGNGEGWTPIQEGLDGGGGGGGGGKCQLSAKISTIYQLSVKYWDICQLSGC